MTLIKDIFDSMIASLRAGTAQNLEAVDAEYAAACKAATETLHFEERRIDEQVSQRLAYISGPCEEGILIAREREIARSAALATHRHSVEMARLRRNAHFPKSEWIGVTPYKAPPLLGGAGSSDSHALDPRY